MTPTERDKELREEVHKLFGDDRANDGSYRSCCGGKWIDMTNEVCAVADFIIADRKRVALEARIDELEKIEIGGDNIWTVDSGTDTAMLIEERVAELKDQQEKL